METGIIKRITDRGFGFISIEGKEKDLFFHSNELVAPLTFEQLKEGDKVQFEITQGEKGENATKVSLAGAESAPEAPAAE